jgi:hypothetical protein
VPCIYKGCTAKTHYFKWRESAMGTTYNVRECENGHRFVVAHDGRAAMRWSSAMEHQGIPLGARDGTKIRNRLTGNLNEIHA